MNTIIHEYEELLSIKPYYKQEEYDKRVNNSVLFLKFKELIKDAFVDYYGKDIEQDITELLYDSKNYIHLCEYDDSISKLLDDNHYLFSVALLRYNIVEWYEEKDNEKVYRRLNIINTDKKLFNKDVIEFLESMVDCYIVQLMGKRNNNTNEFIRETGLRVDMYASRKQYGCYALSKSKHETIERIFTNYDRSIILANILSNLGVQEPFVKNSSSTFNKGLDLISPIMLNDTFREFIQDVRINHKSHTEINGKVKDLLTLIENIEIDEDECTVLGPQRYAVLDIDTYNKYKELVEYIWNNFKGKIRERNLENKEN